MCGLVGLINKWSNGFTKKQQEVFSTLLFLDYLRGNDSTGVFLVENTGDVSVAKEASNPLDFMQHDEYDKIMKKAFSRGAAIIGHNRKATRGTVNDENAHPFVVDDNIVLVHNGTMYGDHKKIADVEVDSHAIAHAIHEHNDPEKALNSFDAAFALIWYDFEKTQLNLIRNNDRPLWWMATSGEWLWASEKCMLDFVKEKHDLVVTTGPTLLKVHDLQQFTLRNKSWDASFKSINIEKPSYKQYSYGPTSHNDNYEAWEKQMRGHNRYWEGDEDLACAYGDAPFVNSSKDDTNLGAALPKRNTIVQTTTEFERDLAKTSNRIVPNGQFHAHVSEHYPQGSTVHAVAFDYSYANQMDATGGYYLYLHLWDDADIICRQWFDSKHVSEERMIQMGGTGYVYKLRVLRKRWSSFDKIDPTGKRKDTPGYCIFETEHPELVCGGGMGDSDWQSKLVMKQVVH